MSKVSKEQETSEAEIDDLLGTTSAKDKQDALEKDEAEAAAKERKRKRREDKASSSASAADPKSAKIPKKKAAPTEDEDEEKEKDDDEEILQHQIQFGDHSPVSVNAMALEESLAREEIQARENLVLRQENETLRLNGNKPVNDSDLTSNLNQEFFPARED